MNKEAIITETSKAFENVPRPSLFIRGTCDCEECLEHNKTMQFFDREKLPLDTLNNPGWDPICFASDQAFSYFLPGLVKLAIMNPDEYIQPFLFHLENSDRIQTFTPDQRNALVELLAYLVLNEEVAMDNHLTVDALFRTKKLLEQ